MVSVDVKQHERRSSITSSRAVRYPRRAAVMTGNNDSNVPIGPAASAVRDVARSETTMTPTMQQSVSAPSQSLNSRQDHAPPPLPLPSPRLTLVTLRTEIVSALNSSRSQQGKVGVLKTALCIASVPRVVKTVRHTQCTPGHPIHLHLSVSCYGYSE